MAYLRKKAGLILLLIVAIAFGTLQYYWRIEKSRNAYSYAAEVTRQPRVQSFPVQGEIELLESCETPNLKATYELYDKGRYEFQISCANGKSAFLMLAMGKNGPLFGVISRLANFSD